MHSIKEKLDISLISVLITIILLFLVYMVALHSFGSSLTPEAYAQIISALATTLVVVLTLGLRLIDDALNRYEKVAKPIISDLRTILLAETGIKSELMNYHYPSNLPKRSRELISTSSKLKRYGRFFLTQLYPQEPLNRTARISSDLDEFLALVRNIVPYWEKSDFGSFLEFSIRDDMLDLSGFSYEIDLEKAKDAVAKLNGEKPELVHQTRKLRERILLEIEKATDELDSFLETN